MQQSLKHIDLPLQLIDTPYLLSNQQVTQIIVLLFAGDGEDDGAAFRRYVEIGFAAGFRRNRGALRLTPLVRSICRSSGSRSIKLRMRYPPQAVFLGASSSERRNTWPTAGRIR